MIRLRLPKPTPVAHADSPLPPELRWDAPTPTLSLLLNRREFLQAAGLIAAVLTVPVRRAGRAYAIARGRFLTNAEFDTLEALCERIIPADADPGAQALGAANYIGRLLSAFDRRRPRIFAGGPFSYRNPFPDFATGTASHRHPHNRFRRFTPLTRLQELNWRAELFGSAAVPELAVLDAQYGGAKIGLQDVYRAGLAKTDQVAQAMFGARFADLAPADQDTVFTALDSGAFAPDTRRGGRTFMDILIQHTLEGCFGAPEYGGNRRKLGRPQGWTMIGIEGDSQPLGYSIFSVAANDYVERPDHPMSTPNPDEVGPGNTVVPQPLSSDGQDIQDTIVLLSGGFSSGIC
jgi:hypothetical protein